MNINQLQYFIAIVKTGSFSQAADEMFISQSSMSKQIKALETELGVELFQRKHSKVFLTDIGHSFFEYAQRTVKDYNDILITVDEFKSEQSKTINIGSIPIVSSYGISAHIAQFTSSSHKYNNIIIDMHENSQKTVMKLLYTRQIDMTLVRTDYLQNTEDYSFIPYKKDAFVLVCNYNHPLSSKKQVTLWEIIKYPISMLDPSSTINTIVTEFFKKHEIVKDFQCQTTRHKILMEIIQANNSITLLPESLVDVDQFPNTMAIPLKEELVSNIALIKLRETKLNKISREFWDYWKNHWELKKQ